MDKPRVFISHSALDSTWARDFAISLQERGIKVLFASSAAHSGETLAEAFEYGLRHSNVIALLVTPETIKRPNLFFEIGAAMGMGKPLIPVISKEVDPSALPISLRGRRYLVKSSPDLTAEEFVSQAKDYDVRPENSSRSSRVH
jgi:hypothetical protein